MQIAPKAINILAGTKIGGLAEMSPGSIVRCRNRDWVLMPCESDAVHLLRPLTGAMDDVVAINRRIADLIGYSLPEERVRPATFPLPTADDLSDAIGAHLLWQAARLTLRDGATPFRSLGRISIRPRIYQFVPLLMALRLDPVRLLIADDVGVGKTIEALLIAREMLDRGEIRRLCVLCPPYLCDQWQRELGKVNLDAVVIRSGTVGQLDRRKPASISIYRHFPIQIVSIDFVKSDRNRHLFLLDCPEFVIVDEAHGAAVAVDANANQQQRHRLLREIAAQEHRHLVLLTATPHSGIEAAFRSLLALLRREFGDWDTGKLAEEQRIELARHFVQRTRRDIKQEWEGEDCFPDRDPADRTYRLSPAYRTLFARTYEFCSEIARSGADLGKWQQRVRYWGALALLRSVMSSPAAAVAALEKRRVGLPVAEEEVDFSPFVFESADDQTDDDQPTPPLEAAETTFANSDRRKLQDLERLARSLHGSAGDTKLAECAKQVADLLRQGFHPIVWCRYIATADYVAERLDHELRPLFRELRVVSVSSRTGGDEERSAKIAELAAASRRVLVATDCLSEGINLQEHLSAVLHYDLPWNPNRLEQREGRVDRYGRTGIVKAIRYFSPDSAVDGVVLDVLLNKAREIHKALGTYVPVPDDSETVTQAVLQALFLRRGRGDLDQLQLDLGLEVPRQVEELHRRWDRDVERERVNRTRFAQRALRPAEVRRELEATDAVLGDPEAVRNFVIDAAQRLGLALVRDKREGVFRIAVSPEATAPVPEAIRFALRAVKTGQWLISFVSPTPEGAEYLGRNHPFVAALARFLLEEALTKSDAATASRCGVIRTRAVARLTTILLLRVRYLLEQPDRAPLLSEEVLVVGFAARTAPAMRAWLSEAESLRLVAEAKPDANVPLAEKRELVSAALAEWPAIEPALRERIAERGAELERSHKRVRQAVGLRVRELAVVPQFPPDLLGILVLQPVV